MRYDTTSNTNTNIFTESSPTKNSRPNFLDLEKHTEYESRKQKENTVSLMKVNSSQSKVSLRRSISLSKAQGMMMQDNKTDRSQNSETSLSHVYTQGDVDANI
jgi:hypothetical protein